MGLLPAKLQLLKILILVHMTPQGHMTLENEIGRYFANHKRYKILNLHFSQKRLEIERNGASFQPLQGYYTCKIINFEIFDLLLSD